MLFRYQAVGADRKPKAGHIEADSLQVALNILKKQGLEPIVAEPERRTVAQTLLSGSRTARQSSLQWRANVFRQLEVLLAAGMPFDRALSVMSADIKQGATRQIIERAAHLVAEGQSLSSALSNCGGGFATDEVAIVRSGEHAGSLVPALNELATSLERRLEARGKLISALIYPAFLLALAPLSLIVIGTVLVPNIAPLFDNNETAMPLVLRAMVWVSRQVHDHGVFYGVIAACVGLSMTVAARSERIRRGFTSAFYRLPVIRDVVRQAEAARVCRTLSAMVRSNVTIQSAVSSSADVALTSESRAALKRAANIIADGGRPTDALKVAPFLDNRSLQMIAVGAETNRLGDMFWFIADMKQKSAERSIERVMTVLTPVLTIVIGLLVGGIVMSIMRAILSVNDLALQ